MVEYVKFYRLNGGSVNIRNFKTQSISTSTDRNITTAVIGIGRGVGTTTVATALAFCFAEKGEKVNFLEAALPQTTNIMIYWKAAFDKRFVARDFYDFYDEVKRDKDISKASNLEEGINWMLVTPYDKENSLCLSEREQARLILRAQKSSCVIDMAWGNGWERYLTDCDYIIAVLEPLPSKMITNSYICREIKRLECEGKHIIWVVNKNTGGIMHHQVRKFIGNKHIIWLEAVKRDEIFKQEYRCLLRNENTEFKHGISEIFTEISH